MSDKRFAPPDFDDMMQLTDLIRELYEKVEKMEAVIDEEVAKTTTEVTTNPNYFVNGKAPSMELVKSTYQIRGLDGNLFDQRMKLAEVKAALEGAKLRFQVMRGMIDIYITDSANARASVV